MNRAVNHTQQSFVEFLDSRYAPARPAIPNETGGYIINLELSREYLETEKRSRPPPRSDSTSRNPTNLGKMLTAAATGRYSSRSRCGARRARSSSGRGGCSRRTSWRTRVWVLRRLGIAGAPPRVVRRRRRGRRPPRRHRPHRHQRRPRQKPL